MGIRPHLQKKASSQSTFTPVTNPFGPRPFAPPTEVSPQQQETPDLQAQQEKPQGFGYNLGKISITNRNGAGRLPIQTKLTIGQPGDKYEQEADSVAAQVVNQINTPVAQQSVQGQTIQRQDTPEEEELMMKPMVQRQEALGGGTATPDLEASINQARSGGQPLGEPIRRQMESAFGANFSGVKIHSDAKSDVLNRSIQARAFTTGNDIFFRQGAYNPGSRSGQELLAHELTHVVQQNGGAVQRQVNQPQKPVQFKAINAIQAQPNNQQNSEANANKSFAEQIIKEVMEKEVRPPVEDAAVTMIVGVYNGIGGIEGSKELKDASESSATSGFNEADQKLKIAGKPTTATEKYLHMQRVAALDRKQGLFKGFLGFGKSNFETSVEETAEAMRKSAAASAAKEVLKDDIDKAVEPAQKLIEKTVNTTSIDITAREAASQAAQAARVLAIGLVTKAVFSKRKELMQASSNKAIGKIQNEEFREQFIQERMTGTFNSRLASLGKKIESKVKNDGDSSKIKASIKVPLDPSGSGFIGFDIAGNVEREGKAVKARVEVAVTGGGKLPKPLNASMLAKLGGYMETQGASGVEAMNMISYAFFRRFRESSWLPREATHAIWSLDGKSGASEYEEAEAFGRAMEENMSTDASVETGAFAGVEVKAGLGTTGIGEAGIEGEARVGAGTRYSKEIIEKQRAKGRGEEVLLRGAQKSIGQSRYSFSAATKATVGPLMGSGSFNVTAGNTLDNKDSTGFLGMEYEVSVGGTVPTTGLEGKIAGWVDQLSDLVVKGLQLAGKSWSVYDNEQAAKLSKAEKEKQFIEMIKTCAQISQDIKATASLGQKALKEAATDPIQETLKDATPATKNAYITENVEGAAKNIKGLNIKGAKENVNNLKKLVNKEGSFELELVAKGSKEPGQPFKHALILRKNKGSKTDVAGYITVESQRSKVLWKHVFGSNQ